jgi:hypothetical protein
MTVRQRVLLGKLGPFFRTYGPLGAVVKTEAEAPMNDAAVVALGLIVAGAILIRTFEELWIRAESRLVEPPVARLGKVRIARH